MARDDKGGAFEPKALWVARSFRGLTVSDVAERAGVSRQTVSLIENGTTAATQPALGAIASSLAFPLEFFFTKPAVPDKSVFHFRRGAEVPEYAIARAQAHACLFGSVTSSFGQFAKFAQPRLPSAEPTDVEAIERAADRFREAIRVRADVPIANAIHAAEAAGIFVGTFDPGPMRIDGFACAAQVPIIMLNNASAWSRRRFSTMHEVGHLVLHGRGSPENGEEQAHRFAGAALVPRASFWREFPRPISRRFDWASLIAMKRRWGVSLQALIYRAYDLGIIDAAQFRTANIHVARSGWKTGEPGEVDAEAPELCARFLGALRQRSKVMALCEVTNLHIEDVELALGVHLESEVETSSVIPIGKRRPEISND